MRSQIVGLNDRLRRLQQAAAKRVSAENALLPIPEEWVERDETGRYVGPPPDADPRAVATFLMVDEMDRRTVVDPPIVRKRLDPD
jgi:hypothetical protein